MDRFFVRYGVAVIAAVWAVPVLGLELVVQQNGSETTLALVGQPPFHSTTATVSNAYLIESSSTTLVIALWDETQAGGPIVPHYYYSATWSLGASETAFGASRTPVSAAIMTKWRCSISVLPKS